MTGQVSPVANRIADSGETDCVFVYKLRLCYWSRMNLAGASVERLPLLKVMLSIIGERGSPNVFHVFI